MDGFYYLFMLIGVAWLCAWMAFPDIVRRYPSPFDYRVEPPPADAGVEQPVLARQARSRRTWRGGKRAEPQPEPVDVQHAVPERRTAQSWRVRREQAEASGRKRGGA
jgi:hypothetical protein